MSELSQPPPLPQVRKRGAFARRLLNLFLFAGLLLLIQAAIASYFLVQYYSARAQAYDLKKLEEFPVSTLFLDRNGEEIGRIFTENRTLLTHEQIPERMRQAVVAMEDERFYEHGGIDLYGLFRAMFANIKARRMAQGGSTLTQQLAKHLINDFSKNIDRKLVEVFLAQRIEKYYSKGEILDFYLNRIYFGKGRYGLASASRGYFNKKAEDLSLGECAMFAGIISAPNRNSPQSSLKRATDRRNVALQKMVQKGFITPQQSLETQAIPISVMPRRPIGVLNYPMAYALKQLEEVLHLPDSDEIPPGLRIYLTLDKKVQDAAQESLAKQLELFAEKAQKVGEDAPIPEPSNPLQGASLVADAQTGAIQVLVGGRNFLESSFDRVSMARRENGAITHPILYTLAFRDYNLHPASMINASFYDVADGPETTGLGDPDRDLAKRFLTVHDCLALGHKYAAGRVGAQLGTSTLLDWYEKAGVVSNQNDEEERRLKPLTLWEACQLYQVLANNGSPQSLYLIEKIVTADDDLIYQQKPKPSSSIVNPMLTKQMALTLESAAKEGRASTLRTDFGFPGDFAGIVGYSESYRDAWFVGYTPTLVGGVWVGYDHPKQLAAKALAQKAALPVWNEVMRSVMTSQPTDAQFDIPEELVKVTINRRTGEVLGQGFFTPGAGNIFVYLQQAQMNQANRHSLLAAQRVEQSDDWSDWLGTMLEEGTDEGLSLEESRRYEAGSIPPVAWYRMPGLRGDILTADGVPLATTKQSQNLVVPWPPLEMAVTVEEALNWMRDRIAKASQWLRSPVEIPDADLRSFYEYKRFHPVTVAENLTDQEISHFPESPLPAAGFSLQGVPIRIYPQGRLASHTIGYLNRIQGRSRGKFMADEVIYDDYGGSAGLEKIFDEELKGEEGKISIKTTFDGFTERIFINKPATIGLNVKTTLDSKLQSIVEKHIETKPTAGVVILNSDNGDILAMATRPDFNPSDFIPHLDPNLWQFLVSHPQQPLKNRVIAQHNPPGSVFKVLTAIASMNAGIFDPNYVVHCQGGYQVGNIWFNFSREFGSVTFRRAVARSYNTYFVDFGIRSGRTAMVETAKEWGFGLKTGLLLPGEIPGNVPTPESVLRIHKRIMGDGDIANMSIGQGDMLVTPLQMANFMAAIANDGTLFVPRLVSATEDADGKIVEEFPPQIIRHIPIYQAEMNILKEAMLATTEEGTGRRVRLPKRRVATKTGTAQVGAKNRPRQIAWIAGFLPEEQPPMAFAIMVEGTFEEDLHGGADAGGLAGAIFKDYFKRSTSDKGESKKP